MILIAFIVFIFTTRFVQDDNNIPPGAGPKQKLTKNRRRRYKNMKSTTKAVGINTLLTRPSDNGYDYRSDEEQTTSHTGKFGKQPRNETSGTTSEPTLNVPTQTRCTDQKERRDACHTPIAFVEADVAVLSYAESATVKPEVSVASLINTD